MVGERTDLTNIRSDADSSVVEALFDISENKNLQHQLAKSGLTDENQSELLIRREVAKTGRSRAWINGNMATLNLLQQIGAELVDIHGQHQHQSLLKPSKQLDLIDDYAGLLPARAEFGKTLTQYRNLEQELRAGTQSQADTLRQQEILQYQIEEINKAALQKSEESELIAERQLLSQAEKLQLLASKAVDELYGNEEQFLTGTGFGGLISGIDRVRLAGEELARIDDSQKPVIAEIENIKTALDEFARTLRSYRDTIVIDPRRLELVEERLNLIHKLKRKYGCESISALLSQKKEWEENLYNLSHQEERIAALGKALETTGITLSELATRLSTKRVQAGKKLGQLITAQLTDLGMTKTRFVVDVNQKEDPDGILEYNNRKVAVTVTGIDQIEFLFSANPGEELKPLSKIISGGELSRVMLAIKTILANLDDVPTLVFDEIDVGIGGEIAQVIGRKLRQLSDSRQVIVITHLPQIAAAAHSHFLVTKMQNKTRTFTKISPIEGANQVQEIARMLSGKSITPSALTHAESLLAEFAGTKMKKNKNKDKKAIYAN
jgi:DNA repair protein RecN (Recombination protein N)